MNSVFIQHEVCPRCQKMGMDNAQDNLGVFSDGHKWCFSCGYYISSEGRNLTEVESKLKQQQKENKYNDLCLPSDYTTILPANTLEWLKRYGITNKEIITNRIGWSAFYENLIFPVFDVSDNLLFYQGRSFSSNRDKPRYSTQGYAEKVFHIIGSDGTDICVLVEDIISAIKVGRQISAMPLWGSNLSIERIIRLSKLTHNLVIWLDADKATYAMSRRIRALPYFESVRCVLSLNDPKEYNDEAIQRFLQNGK